MTVMGWISRAALLVALCAPATLAAQPDAPRRQPTCVREASVAAEPVATRYACAGTGANGAVRVAASLPDGWDVEWQDSGHLVLAASQGDVVIQVAGADQLPEPRTPEDTLGFWMRATGMAAGREVQSADEVDAFRDEAGGRIDTARALATLAQLDDDLLRAMAQALSVEEDEGRTVTRHQLEVRELAGEPAGYLAETWTEDGTEWSAVSYVTVRDGALFIVSLLTPEAAFSNAVPVFEGGLPAFAPRTERW
ncbi:hypothetical protein [Longimicrobium sp.]|uniref:hypothetical protein n=1 Tax=Longimicrobium sp. TaxID=2029185 RepID=UPI002E3508E7|nr:hypothetical protein [Longimicrobium sp.]HEX6039078.1 hypothetical protein [Longimicrobium sp.]